MERFEGGGTYSVSYTHLDVYKRQIFNLDSNEKLADYEGVIEIGSKVTDYDSGISGLGQYGLVYWMTGARCV